MAPASKKFPKLSRELISGIQRTGKRIRGIYFTAYYKDISPELGGFSVIVSKKAAVLAVTRNSLKRRYREILRASLFPSTVAIIIQALKESEKASFDELKKDVGQVLSRLS